MTVQDLANKCRDLGQECFECPYKKQCDSNLLDFFSALEDARADSLSFNDAAKFINEQPTRFEYNKVMKNLCDLRDGKINMQCNACPYLDDDTGCEVCYTSKAIEIFKNGIC